jgi:DNA-binding response OmpR family regulator
MRKVLIIEDDQDIARLVELHLRDINCSADLERDGEKGLRQAFAASYDLIILDLMLPGLDGLEVCRRIRSSNKSHVPILMLTAKSTEVDRVVGLEIGADDYLTKPFSILELVARVKALFRRVEALTPEPEQANGVIERRGLHVDKVKREVTVSGREVKLTAKEFDLLFHFAAHPGRVFTRGQLLDHVWQYGHDGYEHTVNSHINRLRAKIEKDPSSPRYIETVWGVGYRFPDSDPEGGT